MKSSPWIGLAIAAPVLLTPVFAGAADRPSVPSVESFADKLNRKLNGRGSDQDILLDKPYGSGRVAMHEVVREYRETLRPGGSFEEDIAKTMPLFSTNLGSDIYLLTPQSICLSSLSEEALSDPGMSDEKKLPFTQMQATLFLDNSLDMRLTAGRYAGTQILYSNSDKALQIIYSGVRGKDGTVYEFPDVSFVSQVVYPELGAIQEISDTPETEGGDVTFQMDNLSNFTISGDVDKGYLYIADPHGSSLTLDLKKGELHTQGTAFGVDVNMRFTPADSIIRTHVLKLASDFSPDQYNQVPAVKDGDFCTSSSAGTRFMSKAVPQQQAALPALNPI